MSEEKADQPQQEEAKRLETQSIERRRLIGQAIIDGILSPSELIFAAKPPNYDQRGSGDHKQRGGGNHIQTGGGNYDQALAQ